MGPARRSHPGPPLTANADPADRPTGRGTTTGTTCIARKPVTSARWMRDQAGYSMAEIVKRTQIPRSSLYRHLPPRPEVALTAAGEGSMTTKHRQEGDQS